MTEHTLTIDERKVGTLTVYRARCSCGQWQSGWLSSADMASGRGVEHVTATWDD